MILDGFQEDGHIGLLPNSQLAWLYAVQIRRAGEVKFTVLKACMHQLQLDVRGPSGDAPMHRGGRVS